MKTSGIIFVLLVSVVIAGISTNAFAAAAEGSCTVTHDGDTYGVKLQMLSKDAESAEGFLIYSESGKKVKVRIDIAYLKVDGEYAWFAGKCVEGGTSRIDRWFFAAVHDGGEPGRLVDQFWWEWLDSGSEGEDQARQKVENLEIPSQRKSIKSGDIKVSTCD